MSATWRVLSFWSEKGFGRLRNEHTGDEVQFDFEAWSPGDLALGRELQDSDHRRHLLLPRSGEPVDVSWKTSRGGRVVRGRPGTSCRSSTPDASSGVSLCEPVFADDAHVTSG